MFTGEQFREAEAVLDRVEVDTLATVGDVEAARRCVDDWLRQVAQVYEQLRKQAGTVTWAPSNATTLPTGTPTSPSIAAQDAERPVP